MLLAGDPGVFAAPVRDRRPKG
ncbi:MAG: hypothetical protein DME97_03750 [Verrucomicrobia bacterium]|nr:MAG: hypothetical protein DME97_03750 [Verrucomicrobiota bacterium]